MDDVTSVTTPATPGVGVATLQPVRLLRFVRLQSTWQLRFGVTNLTDEGPVTVSSSQTGTDTPCSTCSAVRTTWVCGFACRRPPKPDVGERTPAPTSGSGSAGEHAQIHCYDLRQRHAADEAPRDRRRWLRARGDLRERPARLSRARGGGWRDAARPGTRLRRVPAVPRLRGHARRACARACSTEPNASSTSWKSSAPTSCSSARMSRRNRSASVIASSTTSASSATGLQLAACASDSKRLPGGATSRTTVRRGRSCARSTILQWVWCSIRSARSRATCRSTACARSIPQSCFTSSSPMRRCYRWTRCRGAVISVACRGKATCRWWSTWRRCGTSAIRACSRSRFSMTASSPGRRRTSQSTACARSRTCWRG